MHIVLYKSNLCPRCYLAKKHLYEIASTNSEISIEEIDILSSPIKTLKAGVKLIPAIEIEKKILSGIILTKKNISDFIEQQLAIIS